MNEKNFSLTLMLLNDLLRMNAIDNDLYSKAAAKINAIKRAETKQSLAETKHLPETA